MDIDCRLHGEGVVRRWQIGGGEEDTGGRKDDTPEALDVRVLLRSVRARQREVHLSLGEELAEVA